MRQDKTRQDERGDRRGYERRENSGDRMVGGITRERRAGREKRRGREGHREGEREMRNQIIKNRTYVYVR